MTGLIRERERTPVRSRGAAAAVTTLSAMLVVPSLGARIRTTGSETITSESRAVSGLSAVRGLSGEPGRRGSGHHPAHHPAKRA